MDKWLLSFADSYPLPPTGLPTLLSFHPGFFLLAKEDVRLRSSKRNPANSGREKGETTFTQDGGQNTAIGKFQGTGKQLHQLYSKRLFSAARIDSHPSHSNRPVLSFGEDALSTQKEREGEEGGAQEVEDTRIIKRLCNQYIANERGRGERGGGVERGRLG